jgi:hypothetical protein
MHHELSRRQPSQPRTKTLAPPADAEVCPHCRRTSARIIGRSESHPVLYLHCSECRRTSVAPG